MSTRDDFSRRSFLAIAAAAPVLISAKGRRIPVGLELFSVRNELKKDLMGTVRGVAKMGYQCVEFYAPYYEWTADYARQVKAELDSLGIKCYSTHNGPKSFTLDGLKQVADTLNRANQTMESHGLHAGYHNHDAEWKPIDGQKPIEVLATNTDKSIMLQLDVGTCVETGNDP